MPSAWQKFLQDNTVIIICISQLSLWCLLLVMPVSSITAAREIFTFTSLGAVLLLFLARIRNPVLDPVWFVWLAFFLVAVISLFFSVDVGYSISTIRRELLKGALMFFIGLYALNSAYAYAHTWRFMLACLALMSVCGVFMFLPNLSFDHGLHIINYGRASSLANGYGHFASYLAIMTPYLLVAPRALIFKKKSSWLIWAAILLFTIFSAYFTSTRILWASLVLAGAMCLWFMSKRRLLVGLLGATLLAVVALAVVALPQHNHGEKWYKIFDDPQEMQGTAGDLAMLWSFSYEKLSENPFKGVGFGKINFITAYPEFLEDKANKSLLHAHNVFVDTAMQTGIQGLAVFLLLLIVLTKGLWPKAPPDKGDVPACFRLATVIMLASFILRNQVDEYFVDDCQLLFWLLMGLAWGTRYLKQNKHGNSTSLS